MGSTNVAIISIEDMKSRYLESLKNLTFVITIITAF